MARILLLEDDETIAFGIKTGLEQAGHTIICSQTVAQAREMFNPSIQLALLDLNLPDGSGYEMCRIIKSFGNTPVIFLTVRDSESDVVKGLDMGADDYIVKPFQLAVLNSRINAVLRRTNVNGQDGVLFCDNIRLHTDSGRVWLNESEVLLTSGEYRLLVILLENKNKAMSRNALLERLWDIDGSFVNDNTLTVTMKRLRERLGNPDCIKTLRGIGYRMESST